MAPRIMAGTVTAFLTVLLAGLILSPGARSQTTPDKEAPAHVTSGVCAECHQKEHAAWKGSHHSWALRLPTQENVLGNFNDAVFEHNGVRSRFFTRDGKYLVETDGLDGKPAEFEISYTVGVEPLQQYLVETGHGRLQALDIAWDTKQKRWFHLYPDQKLKAGDGLHWSGPYKNWNARCAECHQTGFVKGYAPKTRKYQSRWSELTIGCEACHGPGAAHVEWARDPGAFQSRKSDGVDGRGLTVSLPLKNAKQEIQLCARCHSRRSPIGANSPPAGDTLGDHYRLALLRNGLYYADGQIQDEVYVYGSFLQSKMYARGVRCSTCHEPHSGALVAKGNAVCTQCHSPAGNADFQSLKKANYDQPSHHHHKAGSPGAKCVNCHMPATTYMRVDPRRDHSFRIPRPALSAKLRTPNACTGCHDGKKAQWAAARLKDWFPSRRAGMPHYGEVLHAGRTRPGPETAEKLLGLALDTLKPAIVRATALNLLHQSASPELAMRAELLLASQDDLVRRAAVRLFERVPGRQRTTALLPLLRDPVKAVRMEAARLMMAAPLGGVPDEDKANARVAILAYQRSLLDGADFPETQMQIAGLAMILREFGTAQQALQTAVTMDPQLADAWLTLARIQVALRQQDRARKTLEQAAGKVPDNAVVQFQLGALYSSARDHGRAITALEKSLKISGHSPVLLDLLAVNHLAAGNLDKARAYAKDLARDHPDHRPSPIVRQLLQMPEGR